MLKERQRCLAIGIRRKRQKFQLGDSGKASWKKWHSRWALTMDKILPRVDERKACFSLKEHPEQSLC